MATTYSVDEALRRMQVECYTGSRNLD